MAKENGAVKPQVSKEFDVVLDIKGSVKISTEAAQEAADKLAKIANEERVSECMEMIKETQYSAKRQLLSVRRNSKLEEIEKEALKKICELGSDGKCCGGLLKDVLDGKLSKQEFEDKKHEILDDYSKKANVIQDEHDKNKRILKTATPGWVYGYDWFRRD